MLGAFALATPRRIKASHRRRRRVASDHLLYILNNPLSGTDPTGYAAATGSHIQGSDIEDTGARIEYQAPKQDKFGKTGVSSGNDRSKSASSSASNGAQPAQTATAGADGRNPGGTTPTTEIGKDESNTLDTIVVRGIGGTSEQDYMQGLYSFWKSMPISEGFTSNKDVRAATIRINSAQAKNAADVELSQEEIDLVNRIAQPTFKVQQRINGERGEIETEFVVQLSIVDGAASVLDAARVPQGGSFVRNPAATVIVHWHYVGLDMRPSMGDHGPVKTGGISGVVVTPGNENRCCKVWEVGRKSSIYRYRDITKGKLRDWKEDKRWNQK